MKSATAHLDVEQHHVVYKGKRHIFLGKTGAKERWIDTHRDDVSFQFHGRTFSVTADADYLTAKGLIGFASNPYAQRVKLQEVGAISLESGKPTSRRPYTSKQMGDACEMVVAAELTLAGVPALKVPDNWPGYDVIAQPYADAPQRISVKSRTFKRGSAYLEYNDFDQFDWLAMVILLPDQPNGRAVYIVPRKVADELARRDQPTSKTAALRYFRIDQIDGLFSRFRDNFRLDLFDQANRPDSNPR